MIKIEMYKGNNCPKCKRAKAMLENCPVDVELKEINVDENEGYRVHLNGVLQSNTLPTFVIEGKVYRGFDENIGKIMEHLGL